MSHYATLGVSRNARPVEIKAAYRKLCLATHPDKTGGGSGEEFAKISEAYQVLSDPQKRLQYDNPPLIDVDLLSHLFRRRRGDDDVPVSNTSSSTHRITLALEDFYSGKICKFAISRKVKCPECGGNGGKSRNVVSCLACNGRGARVSGRGGFGTVSMQMCMQCRGEGTRTVYGKSCRKCKTLGVVRERLVAEAKFEPGAHPGDRVILKGFGDFEKGDVVVVAVEKSHQSFERDGDILKCVLNISLKQSLCGFSKSITHLDGRVLEISCPDVTPPGKKIVVPGEGIPRGHGHLEVTVHVDVLGSNFDTQ